MNTILFEKQNNIAIITLNRPKVFNSFNAEMRQELIAALDDCQADPSVRCVILTGEGRAFCAGQDLSEIVDKETAPSFESILDEGLNRIALKIRQLEKPVIAAVNGVAAGAGANMALACDITVATESASFIQAFSKIGLIPDTGGTWVLPRLIGFARASALMMTGEKVSAQDAVSMGMIFASYPDDTFKSSVEILANTIAKMPTKGLAYTKQILNESLFQGFEAHLKRETAIQGKAASTEDYTEGVSAFVEKRKPNFKGC
jgi:2-(1,2-epoxy-1,2-dihydrophenyl)acetyl-CoA isomerase